MTKQCGGAVDLCDVSEPRPGGRVLVTGAGGFIGAAVCRRLVAAGAQVTATTRGRRPTDTDSIRWRRVPVIDGGTDWRAALDGVAAVVHLAARTHVPAGARGDDAGGFRRLNVDGTRALARQAMAAGVGRFIFMSSIKVNGEQSAPAAGGGWVRFSGADRPRPEDLYGRTKWEAEQVLGEIVGPVGAALLILRPPLVYGPGQKANLLRLTAWVARGLPLPFGAVANLRSLVYVDNLADAVVGAACAARPAGGVFTLADIEVSTPDLIRAIAGALGVEARLPAVPLRWLRAVAALTGTRASFDRLTGSLVVDSTAIRAHLGWRPAVTFAAAMAATAAWFRLRGPRQ